MLSLPSREGPRPLTTSVNPHQQLDQRPPAELVAGLAARCFSLPGVVERPSLVSVPGARALCLQEDGKARPEAFMAGREFAHIHPLPDGSLHLSLTPDDAREVLARGWGEEHPMVRAGVLPPGIVMIYAPRTEPELDVVMRIVQASLRFAAGTG